MSTYIEYKIQDGTTLLVELSDKTGEIVRSSQKGPTIINSSKSFTEAFASTRSSIQALIAEMEALRVEEGEVKFGLKALAEGGMFAVGKIGAEINYEITLKWKNPK